MYAREIAGTAAEEYKDAQWQCSDCEASDYEWRQRGRCSGPFPDGPVLLQVVLDGNPTSHTYPEEFASCPKGLLRRDIFPEEVATHTLVSQAAAADVDKRWPDVPGRLYALLREWRDAEAGRMDAQHRARMDAMKGQHGAQ